MKTINIGICGLGTVGQGVWKHLGNARATLEENLGIRLALRRASVRDLKKKRTVRIAPSRLTTDAMAVATDPDIPIVCELIGGTGLARKVTLAALRAGKTVVSANKALLCEHGPEILDAARRHGGDFRFEASVAGGVPIIKAIREGLAVNRFPLIYGILNGTCNYILTRMEREGLGYAEILAEAKKLGYAEAEESLDVEGWDTAHKASVLAFLAHGAWVPTRRMVVEGITRVTQEDFSFARENGYAIKLLAVISRDFAADGTGGLAVRVYPALVSRGKVLASVNGVNNAVAVLGDVAGETVYFGRGAGQDPTASAVISDIIDAAQDMLRTSPEVPFSRPSFIPVARKVPLMAPENITGCHYLRMVVKDETGVLAKVATVTAGQRVSIASVLQQPGRQPGMSSLILTTHESNERAIRETVARLARLNCVLAAPLLLRIHD